MDKVKTGNDSESLAGLKKRKLQLKAESSSFVPSSLTKRSSKSPKAASLTQPIINETNVDQEELDKIIMQIINLKNKSLRDEAFKQLSLKIQEDKNLPSLLWHTPGVIVIMLQEIIITYPLLSNNQLDPTHMNKLINVLGLFQVIAQDPKTKLPFLKSNLHLYFYPLINTANKMRHYENLRVHSLAVIGALVKKDDNTEVINYLVKTELIVLCLRTMKKGTDMAKSVAIFIVRKILMNNAGLEFVCTTEERLQAVVDILKDMVNDMDRNQQTVTLSLAKQILRCFLRLSENMR